MNNTRSILDRINNLISDDSKILEDFNKKIKTSNANKTKAEEEKKNFEQEITDVQKDIDDITKTSEISERFSDLDSYMPGLEKLGKSVSLLESLKQELDKIPQHIETLENKIKELTDESDNRTKVIKEEEDNLAKLEVDVSDAKRYQENLIELIELSKSGDINKTREEVVETLMHVGFSDKEAIPAAKVILFPEDDLIPYFNRKNEVKEEIKEEIRKEVPEETKDEISLEGETEEIVLENIDDDIKLSPVDVAPALDKDKIASMIESYGFDASKFNLDELDIDEDIIRTNINFILEKKLNKEFVYLYPNIIVDSSLIDKYNYVLESLGKSEDDIKLLPQILTSYSLNDLEKLVEVTAQTGINPKLIPLVVYLKGLQSFLRNYVVLKDNKIELDDNTLSKFAIILSINPVDFKKSLQTLLDYHVNLKKNDGKIAIIDLASNSLELTNKMDMLINIGEEDIIKYYPEVLSTDVKELANRLLFLKRSQIPYKTSSHNKVVYQSFVLRQDVLDKVLDKKVELHEVLDRNETNEYVKEILNNDDIYEELEKIDDNFEMISNTDLDDYKSVIKKIKGKYKETDNSYLIGNYSFSKNKVNRIINYLLSIFTSQEENSILISALLYDSRMKKEDMDSVVSVLNINGK